MTLEEREQRQELIQSQKRTNRSLDQYNDTFEYALPGGILKYLNQFDQPIWVDLGCGDGLAQFIAAHNPSLERAQLVGIDIRRKTVMARVLPVLTGTYQSGMPNLQFSQQDLDGNPHPELPSGCHLITCLMLDRYLEDPLPMLLAAINSLSSEGLLLFTSSAYHYIRTKDGGQSMLKYYLRKLLANVSGELTIGLAGNTDKHLGDLPVEVWTIRRGRQPLVFEYHLNDGGELVDGGYWQEYFVSDWPR